MVLSAGAGLALKNLGIFVAWLMEREMATHSSILAWKIQWMEEPGAIVHGVTKSQTDGVTNTTLEL